MRAALGGSLALTATSCSYETPPPHARDAGLDAAVGAEHVDVDGGMTDAASAGAQADCAGSSTCAARPALADACVADPASSAASCTDSPSPLLRALQVRSGTLWPRFAPNVVEYQVFLGVADVDAELTPTTESRSASITIDGASAQSGVAAKLGPVSLFSDKRAEVTVVSDGDSRTYGLTFIRSLALQGVVGGSDVGADAAGFGGGPIDNTSEYLLPTLGAIALADDGPIVGNPVRGGSRAYAQALGRWSLRADDYSLGRPSVRPDEPDDYGSAVALGRRWLAVSAPHFDPLSSGKSSYRGNVAIIDRDATEFNGSSVNLRYGEAQGPGATDWFGLAMAVSQDTLVVGAPHDGTGAVFVYEFDGTRWNATQRLDSELAAYAFGFRVAISGDWLAIASPGFVELFARRNGRFEFQQRLSQPGETDNPYFGWAIAFGSGRLAVSERRRCSSSCTGRAAVHIYAHDGHVWSQTGLAQLPDALMASEVTDPREFGAYGIAFEGKLIIVSSPTEGTGFLGLNRSDARLGEAGIRRYGSAFLFEEHGEEWVFAARLGPPPPGAAEAVAGGFGRGLALSGTRLAVGSAFAGEANHDASPLHGQVHLYGIDCSRVPEGAPVPGC